MSGVRCVLFGPPGAGKGTQGARLSRLTGVAVLSTGDVLRDEVRSGSQLGRRVEETMARGELVDDGLMTEVLECALDPGAGFILDGFPRTVPQARSLAGMLSAGGLDAVIALEVPEDVLMERMRGRASESGERRRSDDTIETFANRLRVYREASEPVLSFYEARGLLHRIDGRGTEDGVFGRLLAALNLQQERRN